MSPRRSIRLACLSVLALVVGTALVAKPAASAMTITADQVNAAQVHADRQSSGLRAPRDITAVSLGAQPEPGVQSMAWIDDLFPGARTTAR